MVGDRKNYVMSVEFAMKREIAFREKIESTKDEQRDHTAVIVPQNVPLPFQVNSSTLTQTPTTTPTPAPNPNPYCPPQIIIPNPVPVPYTGPALALAPPSRPNLHLPGPNPNPIPFKRPSFNRTSRPTYQAYQKRKTPFHHQPKRPKVYEPEDFNCSLCQVDCNSEINLRMHLKGQKHKAMLRNAHAKKVLGGTSEGNDDKLHCEVCGIWCTDAHAFTLHLNVCGRSSKTMASERGKYVMSVELALQREMAYREKLQLKQANTSVNCLPSPKQISVPGSSCVPRPPSSTTFFRPKPQPTQSPNLPQKPISSHFRPTIGPRPTATFPHKSASYRASPTPKPVLQSPPSYPTFDIRPSSRPTLSTPLTKPASQPSRPTIGQRPMATLSPVLPPFRASPTPKPILQSPTWGGRMSPSIKPLIDLTPSPTHKRKEVPNEQIEPNLNGKLRKLYCEVCEVHCSSNSNLQMHLMGQKHKSRMNGNGKINVEDPILYCDLCGIWCMNEFCFKQHVSGKSHIKKLH